MADDFVTGRAKTTSLIFAAAVMERMDEQILPAVYNFVGATWHATPSQLGGLTLARSLVQALSSPVGGFLGHFHDRIRVTAAGCLLWACMTALFGCASSLRHGMAAWAVNGLGLAMVIPSGQSLIADYYGDTSRGKAFGGLFLTGAIGGMLGSLYATNLGGMQVLGVEGWRVAFFTVACVSALIGLATLAFGRDPNFRGGKRLARVPSGAERPLRQEVKDLLCCPTFLVIILQGILGTIPWTAIVFLTLYLQLIGMSDLAASALMSLFLTGTAAGGLLGGYLGDRAAARYPNHGRIFVVQISVITGPIFSLWLFKAMPLNGENATVATYAVLLLAFGLMKSWSAPACNNPIFSVLVPAHCRNLIFAFDRCFEGALASCAAPLVGLLAEKYFGFDGTAARSADVDQNLAKARALGNALLVFLLVPWTLCLLFYTGLHYTYPRDRLRIARLEASASPAPELADPERQRLWNGDTSDTEWRRKRG